MKIRSFFCNIFPILCLVFALSPLGHAVVANRIASVATEARTPLQNTVSPRARSSVDLGVAPGSLKLDGLMLQFNRSAAQQAALNQLMADQQNPASPRYHKWLTPQQFGAQFGLSASDIARVTSWLTAQGFTVTGVAKSSTFVTFSGTAAQVQQAFGTAVHTVSLGGERHIANLTDPVLPSAIASVVANISGLNDFRPQSHLRVHPVLANAIRPHFTGTSSHALAPADFSTIYDVTPLTSSNSLSGAGIGKCSSSSPLPCGDIAVMGQVDITSYTSDIAAFRAAAGVSPTTPAITMMIGNPNPGAPSNACLTNPPTTTDCHPSVSDLEESLLDIEWAGSIAPSANIIFVTSTNVISTSLIAAIDYNVAPIISISYGQCENTLPPTEVVGVNSSLEQASVQGITVLGPTGDDGATDCDTGVTSATQGLAVDFPGSSPYVTGLGGTMFVEGADSSAYWNPTNDSNGGSAKGYIPENVWNETPTDIGLSQSFGAGGGGASIYFSKPTWQTGMGVPPDDGVRDVPDISLNAASDHDGYLICVLSSCTGGNFYNSSGNAATFGGTSVATPAFAGVMALVEQGLGTGRLGNINPNIYAMANGPNYHSIFHDITSGDNKSPCTAGTKDCPDGGSIGFVATQGYDQASGWGSIDAYNFLTQWVSPSTQPPGGTVISTTAMTATPTSVAAGTAVSLAITVASGSPYTGTPTGTVQIQVDGATVGSATLPTGSGTVSYSLNTTGLTVATHTVTAIYSGDAIFSGSQSAPVTITITSAGTGTGGTTTSLTTVTPTPNSVAAGTAISLAIAVAPGSTSANIPTGTVQIEVDGAAVATSTALVNGRTTYLLSTNAIAAGTHTVTAIYPGDTNFSGSQGSASITILAPSTSSDFTITPSTVSVSTIVGEKVPAIVFTLTPVNGFTGPITLTASDTSKDQLTSAFSVNPVVINSANGATTTLTFTAFKSLADTRGEGKTGWYVAGSGATLACMFLLVLPRRRRWGALLAVLLSVGAIGASGCGSGGTLPTSATYNVTITATAAGNLSHAATVNVTFNIR